MTALNFPDSPSNGDTYQSYTYNSTKGTWAKPVSPDPAITSDGSTPSLSSGITGAEVRTLIGAQQSGVGTTAVVANVAALPGSASTGDMAFVTGTNRLYLWNGSGWYNIALINATPSISGANATYTLAQDGTATTVTITATDPEGLPITYSIASDTSGNIATVAQGTGASTNVFTITPSTNTAHAGTFSLTFRASDGINIASAVSAFTLTFNVTNKKYTTGLFTSVGANNAVNTTFDDKSTSNHTITVNGDAHQTTFSPYRSGGYSMYFDGNDHFTTAASTDHDFGTGDWTIELWVWLTRHSGTHAPYAGNRYRLITNNIGGPAGAEYISIGNDHSSDGPGYLCAAAGVGSPYDSDIIASGQVPVEQWVHCAFSKSSGTLKIFQDGTEVASVSDSQSWDFSNGSGMSINKAGWNTVEYFHGYQRDFRITKGVGRYTSNFTPPAVGSLTVDSDTKLLVFDTPYLRDKSATNHAMTAHGNPRLLGYGATDTGEYIASDHGGSIACDGTGDSIQISGGSDFTFTGDFTAECWVYCTAHTNDYAGILAFSHDGESTGWNLLVRSNGKLHINVGMTYTDVTGSLPLNQWTHLALVRYGSDTGNCKLYINGVADATTVTKTGTVTQPTFIQIGQYPAIAARAFTGNIADVRVVNGTAVYTSSFTPTTAPLTAVTNTKLLVQSTDAGIIDKAQNARKTLLVGNTKSSTTQTKFLSSSMYFDGTGDYINAENCDIGNVGLNAFTFEGWFYLTASPSNYITILQTRGSNASTTGFVMAISASDFYVYSGAFIGQRGSAISSNQWYHWAYTRDTSGNQRVFLDGTQTGSTYTTERNYTDDKLWIGAKYDSSEYFTGYQSDVRITKGLARYTANFTPPTAALKG